MYSQELLLAAKDTYPSRIFACCAIFGVVWSLRGSAFGSKVVAVCVGNVPLRRSCVQHDIAHDQNLCLM